MSEPTEKKWKRRLEYIDAYLDPVDQEKLSKWFRFSGKPTKDDFYLLEKIDGELNKTLLVEIKAQLDSIATKPATKEAIQEASFPPPLAEFCVSLFAPKNTVQALLGDLQEMFQKNVARFGEKQARRMYWLEVAASGWPLLWTWIKRIGLFAAVAEHLRRKFGL